MTFLFCDTLILVLFQKELLVVVCGAAIEFYNGIWAFNGVTLKQVIHADLKQTARASLQAIGQIMT